MRFSELVTVTALAAVVAVGGRMFLHLPDGSTLVRRAIDQVRNFELVRRSGEPDFLRRTPLPLGDPSNTEPNPPSLPEGTPTAIVEANQSVVMLRADHAVGSGVILTPDGLILTNRHVVRGGGFGKWKVRMADNRELTAKVVNPGLRGNDMRQDLALVQIEGADNLPVAKLAESDPQKGDEVWAIGAPYAQADVITKGIFTTLTPDGIVLSNTEIHPGNSGGPLLNQQGEVIGINTGYSSEVPSDQSTASISVDLIKESLQAMTSGGTAGNPYSSRTNPPYEALRPNRPEFPFPYLPRERYAPGV